MLRFFSSAATASAPAVPSRAPSPDPNPMETRDWVYVQYRAKYWGEEDEPTRAFRLNQFKSELSHMQPDLAQGIEKACDELDYDTCEELCKIHPSDGSGKFVRFHDVVESLAKFRPDLSWFDCKDIVNEIQQDNVEAMAPSPVEQEADQSENLHSQISPMSDPEDVQPPLSLEDQVRAEVFDRCNRLLSQGNAMPESVISLYNSLIHEKPEHFHIVSSEFLRVYSDILFEEVREELIRVINQATMESLKRRAIEQCDRHGLDFAHGDSFLEEHPTILPMLKEEYPNVTQAKIKDVIRGAVEFVGSRQKKSPTSRIVRASSTAEQDADSTEPTFLPTPSIDANLASTPQLSLVTDSKTFIATKPSSPSPVERGAASSLPVMTNATSSSSLSAAKSSSSPTVKSASTSSSAADTPTSSRDATPATITPSSNHIQSAKPTGEGIQSSHVTSQATPITARMEPGVAGVAGAASAVEPSIAVPVSTGMPMATAQTASGPPAHDIFRDWVHLHYLELGFDSEGFKGFPKVISDICELVSNDEERKRVKDIFAASRKVKNGAPGSLGTPKKMKKNEERRLNMIQTIKARFPELRADKKPEHWSHIQGHIPDAAGVPIPAQQSVGQLVPIHQTTVNSGTFLQPLFPGSFLDTTVTPDAVPSSENNGLVNDAFSFTEFPSVAENFQNNLLARKLKQLNRPIPTGDDVARDSNEGSDNEVSSEYSELEEPDESLMDSLMANRIEVGASGVVIESELQHAPLFKWSMLTEDTKKILPQYGLLGCHEGSKLLLNTNVPFSTFICGVQGSGKSHTTSTILENSLIRSKHLGRLQKPLSALVLSYGHFGSGNGFNICEATFLAAANDDSDQHAKKVNVLVSPSNYLAIREYYMKVPNVTVTPFRIKPWNLNIDVMLTLMAVKESESPPLYMAQVSQILRELAAKSRVFNYLEFRALVNQQKFNKVQKQMLGQRLKLLEWFLDLDNSCPEPTFHPGEITIMDMSCPFVDPNTACILFRIGVEQYLQSSSPGKMVVLDEAHKYMLDVPGAKALNETMLQTIRLQRHLGTRVIISTQEPTLLTDLIALCSVTVIHRFTSPEWLGALKRHIPMATEDNNDIMQSIESLKTGWALVYSSNAVLGKNQDGSLKKGTGKLLEVCVRSRVTWDGGESILAS